MTKLGVFHTMKVLYNMVMVFTSMWVDFEWKIFYVEGVVFVNKLTLLCFHFKFLYLVFAMLFIIYTFCCHVFSHHFYNAYTLKLLFLIIRNVTTKKNAMTWAL